MRQKLWIVGGMAVMLFAFACKTSHEVESRHDVAMEIKPIHITIDINLKVDRALDDFFNDVDAAEKSIDEKSLKKNPLDKKEE